MKTLILIISLLTLSFSAYAERGHHYKHRDSEHRRNQSYFWQDVNHRRDRQVARIERGIEKGQLTRRELRELRKELKHIAKHLRSLKHQGYLRHREKRDVMEHLDFMSERIRHLKHNRFYAKRHPVHKYQRYSHTNPYKAGHREYDRKRGFFSWRDDSSAAGVYFRF